MKKVSALLIVALSILSIGSAEAWGLPWGSSEKSKQKKHRSRHTSTGLHHQGSTPLRAYGTPAHRSSQHHGSVPTDYGHTMPSRKRQHHVLGHSALTTPSQFTHQQPVTRRKMRFGRRVINEFDRGMENMVHTVRHNPFKKGRLGHVDHRGKRVLSPGSHTETPLRKQAGMRKQFTRGLKSGFGLWGRKKTHGESAPTPTYTPKKSFTDRMRSWGSGAMTGMRTTRNRFREEARSAYSHANRDLKRYGQAADSTLRTEYDRAPFTPTAPERHDGSAYRPHSSVRSQFTDGIKTGFGFRTRRTDRAVPTSGDLSSVSDDRWHTAPGMVKSHERHDAAYPMKEVTPLDRPASSAGSLTQPFLSRRITNPLIKRGGVTFQGHATPPSSGRNLWGRTAQRFSAWQPRAH